MWMWSRFFLSIYYFLAAIIPRSLKSSTKENVSREQRTHAHKKEESKVKIQSQLPIQFDPVGSWIGMRERHLFYIFKI
jgi:hypothetical protein